MVMLARGTANPCPPDLNLPEEGHISVEESPPGVPPQECCWPVFVTTYKVVQSCELGQFSLYSLSRDSS
ncbi:unnamed protein product [Calypogeia fissa]